MYHFESERHPGLHWANENELRLDSMFGSCRFHLSSPAQCEGGARDKREPSPFKGLEAAANKVRVYSQAATIIH